MALRFRRRVKIVPGLNLNIGKRGISLSAVRRGSSVTYGARGLYGNVGLPGSGLSYRKRLDKKSMQGGRVSTSDHDMGDISFHFILKDDGRLDIVYSDGSQLPQTLLKRVRQSAKGDIQEFLQESCREKNRALEQILSIYKETPAPESNVDYVPVEFDENMPQPFPAKKYGILGAIFKSQRYRIDRFNEEQDRLYGEVLLEWSGRKLAHEDAQRAIKEIYDRRNEGKEYMAQCLEHRVSMIDWMLETTISYEFSDDLKTVWVDVDLPEIEDMPSQSAIVSERPLGLKFKNISDSDARKNYVSHIHSAIFRIIGEVFVCLPNIQDVVISGYSQRLDKSTGHISDEYLLSLRVNRGDWGKIKFKALNSIDVVRALENFDLRRDMTKSGHFKAIAPFVQE